MTINGDDSAQQPTGANPQEDGVELSVAGQAAAAAEQGEDVPEQAAAELAAALADAEAKSSEHWDKYLRAVAELDNVRKRAQRDVEQAHRFANERLVAELLAVADSLEAAMASGDQASAEALLEGSSATLKLLLATLDKFGVTQIDPHGEPFDPQQHEAMTMVPSPAAEPDSVLEVVQKGYSLNGRLVRPARVVVASAPEG